MGKHVVRKKKLKTQRAELAFHNRDCCRVMEKQTEVEFGGRSESLFTQENVNRISGLIKGVRWLTTSRTDPLTAQTIGQF